MLITVPNLIALGQLWAHEYDEGAAVWVTSEQTPYCLEKNSGVTGNGEDVIAPIAGAPIAGASNARWIRSQRTALTAVKTGSYNAARREMVRCNPTAGGFAVTLPSAVDLMVDDAIIVVNDSSSTNAIVVTAAGGELINGDATYSLAVARGVVSLLPNGVGWFGTPPL